MDNVQNQISDTSSLQQTTSQGQTLAAELQNFITKDLGAVTKNADGLNWSEAGNQAHLKSFMQNVYSLFYTNVYQEGSEKGGGTTWGSLQIYLPNGETIPFLNADGS